MRRILVALTCMAVVGSAQAFDPRILMPSPLSMAITVGQWMMKDRVETYYLRVKAAGRDEEDARNQAFRLAVNQAVGSLLVSETEIRNRELIRHDIINYSSGYVHDFKILNRYNDGRDVVIEIDVWVRKSQIADRLLNKSADAGAIEGGKISQQIESLQRERATGDRLLLTVLKDYPYRAFDVRVLPTQVIMDQNRNPVLQIITEISWNRNYLDSIGSAVQAINQKKDCDRFIKPLHCDRATVHIRAGDGHAWMDDEVAWHLFLREMIVSKPKLQIDIINTDRTMIAFRQCWGVNELDQENYSSWRYVDVDAGRVRINSGAKQRFITHLPLSTLGVSPRELDSVEVKIVRKQDCRYK